MGVDMQMFVKNPNPLKKDEVLAISYSLCEKFSVDKFFVQRPGESSFYKNGRHALEIIKQYEQDGPTIKPQDGEQFIEVHLWTRFWGDGYERGDILLAINVAEFLETQFPECEVWMGGDSSGINAELFDKVARAKAKKLFFKVGHAPYRENNSVGDFGGRYCGFCQHQMNQYGFGGQGNYAGFICYGCGLKEETRDAGKSWQDITKEKQ